MTNTAARMGSSREQQQAWQAWAEEHGQVWTARDTKANARAIMDDMDVFGRDEYHAGITADMEAWARK